MKTGHATATAQKWDAQALAAYARAEHNARVCRRLLALHKLALGHSVGQAAHTCLMSVSQIYKWINRDETQGLQGLRD